jgi:hypothetical protein
MRKDRKHEASKAGMLPQPIITTENKIWKSREGKEKNLLGKLSSE